MFIFKYFLLFIFIFTIIIYTLLPNKTIAEWAYSFVVWDGYTYVVSDEYVTEVDREIGNVTIYSSIEGTYSGNFSNVYKEGTKYYSIKGIQTDVAISVQESEGKYKKANSKGMYSGAIVYKKNKLKEEINRENGDNNNLLESNNSILLLVFLLTLIFGIPLFKKKVK